MCLEIIKIVISLIVGILPFVATIVTIIYYVCRDEKSRKVEKQKEEKKFLKEKLEIIVSDILDYNLKVEETAKRNGEDTIDLIPKDYKKAFYLSRMYFSELYKIIGKYELSITHRKTVKDGITGEYEPVYNRKDIYSEFLKQIDKEIEKINNM